MTLATLEREVNLSRTVLVVADRTPLDALEATGCSLTLIRPELLDGLPVSAARTAEVQFFSVNPYRGMNAEFDAVLARGDKRPDTSANALLEHYASRNLVPADLFTLAAAVEADRSLARKFVRTIVKDAEDRWCVLTFLTMGTKPVAKFERVLLGALGTSDWQYAGVAA